jgi:hypothetical protein
MAFGADLLAERIVARFRMRSARTVSSESLAHSR